MHRFKRDIWKAGIAVAGLLLLLVFMVWFPVSAGANERVSGFATPVITVTVQATPTEDATVTTLNKEKLAQEVQQLKNQNAPDFLGWLRTNSAILLSTLVVVIGGLIGLFRWFEDRRSERDKRDEEQQRWLKDQAAEREKQAEERFQKVVEGLGSERTEAKVGAAITLHTFLQPGYEQFYRQAFELAVAYLQIRHVDPNTPTPIDPLSRALITVFKDSFPKTRDASKQSSPDLLKQYPDFFDASRVNVDNGYFVLCPLNEIWMRDAYLRDADLSEADMSGADLCGARLNGAVLSKANLTAANLRGADLRGASLSGAVLYKADLGGVCHLEEVLSLDHTNLHGVKGLTKEQLEACKAKGAIIDEDAMISSSQPPVSTPEPPSSNYIQAPLAPSAQESTPLSNADWSSATSSKPSPES